MSQVLRPPITTHILDTERGSPAAGVDVVLLRETNGNWQKIAQSKTNADGRVEQWDTSFSISSGTYQLQFAIDNYFNRLGITSFYPHVVISFTVSANDQHYHVPLLLSAHGYTTYRGS